MGQRHQLEGRLANDAALGLGQNQDLAGHLIRKLNRDVAAFLRANPAADVAQDRLHRCLDAVESPWPRREENLLRLAWEREFETSAERARHLVEEVEPIGAEPYHAPEPLPPIETEEIHLITWMAIEGENAAAEVAIEPGFPRIGLINGRQLVDPLVEHWNDIPQKFQERLGLKPGLVRI
jgi:hypothetical protein